MAVGCQAAQAGWEGQCAAALAGRLAGRLAGKGLVASTQEAASTSVHEQAHGQRQWQVPASAEPAQLCRQVLANRCRDQCSAPLACLPRTHRPQARMAHSTCRWRCRPASRGAGGWIKAGSRCEAGRGNGTSPACTVGNTALPTAAAGMSSLACTPRTGRAGSSRACRAWRSTAGPGHRSSLV